MKNWYKDVVGYQIYPSTFKDGNNDGFGDIVGIIDKLDYLKELGIGLIWIGPIYKSPKVDNGYDISNFYEIDEKYGTLEDVKLLLKECKKREIKVIFDLVLNHTSDKHEWFIDACENVNSKYKDYYIFKEPKVIDGIKYPPNNWKGFFEESVWEYVEKIDKYYFHIFSKKMPDLNWDNKDLREEMYAVARFWLDLGVDGFRMDAIAHLAKDTSFKDAYPLDEKLVLDTSKFSNRDELFDYLKEFKEEVLSKYNCMSIGEVGGCASVEDALKYVDYNNGYFNMVFNFDTCWENGAYGSIDKADSEIKTNVKNLKLLFKKWHDGIFNKAWMPIYWLNHDHPRVISQYGNINYRNESGKMLGLTLLFLYGTPFIYQGEEIGMSNVNYRDFDMFNDVHAKNFIEEYKSKYDKEVILRFLNRTSRDNARTMMQWNDSENGGFTDAKSVFKVNDNYKIVNVENELKDDDSILNFYKKMIFLRNTKYKNEATLGKLEFIDLDNEDVFAYTKTFDKKIMVIANFRDYIVEFDNYIQENDIILHNYKDINIKNKKILLRPYECFFLEIKGF